MSEGWFEIDEGQQKELNNEQGINYSSLIWPV